MQLDISTVSQSAVSFTLAYRSDGTNGEPLMLANPVQLQQARDQRTSVLRNTYVMIDRGYGYCTKNELLEIENGDRSWRNDGTGFI